MKTWIEYCQKHQFEPYRAPFKNVMTITVNCKYDVFYTFSDVSKRQAKSLEKDETAGQMGVN